MISQQMFQLGRSFSTTKVFMQPQHSKVRMAATMPLRQGANSQWTKLLTTVHGLDSTTTNSSDSCHASQEKEQRTQKKMEAEFSNVFQSNHFERANMLYSLSFATPFSDFVGEQSRKISSVTSITNPSTLMLEQMDHARQNRRTLCSSQMEAHSISNGNEAILAASASARLRTNKDYDSALPRTLEEALQDSTQARVITKATSPFEIVSVNSAWEKLCGYKKEECVGKTLSILQGPETDTMAATSIIGPLMNGQEVGTVLINYDKNGRKFYNRLRACPLTDSQNEENGKSITHFLGVLLEVNPPMQQFTFAN